MFVRLFNSSPSHTDSASHRETTPDTGLPTPESFVTANDIEPSPQPDLQTATSQPVVEDVAPPTMPEPQQYPLQGEKPELPPRPNDAGDVIAPKRGPSTFSDGISSATPPHEATLHERAATAQSIIPPEETAKILKTEANDAKRISKIIVKEAKAEDKLLKAAIDEISVLQKVQKDAFSSEAHAIAAHGKAVKFEQKVNRVYLDAKAKWEVADADLKAKTEEVEAVKAHLKQQTELLQEKSKEVEAFRERKSTDDRERQAKLAVLKNPALATIAQ